MSLFDLCMGKTRVKITKDMKLAMARYYINYSRQKEHKWDKKADLEAINKLATKAGFEFQASAGVFVFKCLVKRVGHLSNCIIECNVEDFLDGGNKMVFAPSCCEEY